MTRQLAAATSAVANTMAESDREILEAIARHAGASREVRTVSIVPNHPHFSTSNFRYYAIRDGRREGPGFSRIDYRSLRTR